MFESVVFVFVMILGFVLFNFLNVYVLVGSVVNEIRVVFLQMFSFFVYRQSWLLFFMQQIFVGMFYLFSMVKLVILMCVLSFVVIFLVVSRFLQCVVVILFGLILIFWSVLVVDIRMFLSVLWMWFLFVLVIFGVFSELDIRILLLWRLMMQEFGQYWIFVVLFLFVLCLVVLLRICCVFGMMVIFQQVLGDDLGLNFLGLFVEQVMLFVCCIMCWVGLGYQFGVEVRFMVFFFLLMELFSRFVIMLFMLVYVILNVVLGVMMGFLVGVGVGEGEFDVVDGFGDVFGVGVYLVRIRMVMRLKRIRGCICMLLFQGCVDGWLWSGV